MSTRARKLAKPFQSGRLFQAVFASWRLPDGGYRNVIEMALRLAEILPAIVCVPAADGGWTDVLEAGAAAVLAPPYHRIEILRILDALPLWAAHGDPAPLGA
jgi:hypothetical protein